MQMRTHVKRMTALALAAGLTAAAAAQNGSLLLAGVRHGGEDAARGTGVATNQPSANRAARQTPPVPLEATAQVVRARRDVPEPPPDVQNPVLRAVSPIAVPAPEPRRYKINDQVTVIVRQTRETKSDAKMSSDKEWTLESALEKFIRLDGEHRLIPQNFSAGTPGVDFEFENSYEGEGKSDRKDSLTTRITATVIDVKPNGNLALEAKSRIKVDEDEQIMTLTGTCRAEDVTAQNTVLSTQLANLEVVSTNTGAVRDATRRGWLMRAFDWLRPL